MELVPVLAAHRDVRASWPGCCSIPRHRHLGIVVVVVVDGPIVGTGAVARRPVVPVWRCAAKTTVVVGGPMPVALAPSVALAP